MVAALTFAGLAIGFFNVAQEGPVTKSVIDDSKTVSTLRATIYQCDDITERAAAHLKAVVEFQKLEIIGRKARVFKLCMQDRGYQENIAWLNYSQVRAGKIAKETNVSIAEALENLRRSDMKVPMGEKERPTFWVKK
jgi:hypothetical protein